VITTWLTQQLGLEVPVVLAPMGGASGGRLAAAVSQAGGLGVIGFASGSAEQLRAESSVVAATGKPFGVGLLAWTLPQQEQLVEAAIESGASLISVSYGDYEKYVDRIRAAGIVTATQVGTMEDLRVAHDAGVDVIVARGSEGGGHGRDAVATLPLLQMVLEATDKPVLAAGGIANRRGLAAVIAAGASGAWVGSAFLACDEGDNSDAGKDAVVKARADDTVATTVFDIGRRIPWPTEFPGRALRSAYSDAWHGKEDEIRDDPPPMDEPTYWAGQAVGMVTKRQPAAAVIAEFRRAEELLRSTSG
jgi:nitronate monooxygenase